MDDRRQAAMNRIAVFGIALLVRGVLAWIFFGSVDTTNDLLNTARMFAGWRGVDILVPYFPGIQLILWASGVIATYTPLPLTFPYKIFGCLFDSLLALAIYDSLSADRRRAFRAGLFYALAPIPIIVAAIHGQRDGVCLAFMVLAFLLVARKTRLASAIAGAAFVVSMIVKPITIPLLPLLFPSPRAFRTPDERRRAYALAGGAAVVFVVYVAILVATDEVMMTGRLRFIADYAAKSGFSAVGLPLFLGIGPMRVWSFIALVIPIVLYWKGWLNRERAAAVMYAWLLGTGNYSTQYLLWVVPFLILAREFRFAAFYNALAGLFLVIHYSHPGPTRMNFHNLGAFGPRVGMEWLSPAATHLGVKSSLYLYLADLIIPLTCIAFAIYVVVQQWQRKADEQLVSATPMFAAVMPFVAALALTGIAVGYALAKPEPSVPQFTQTIREKVGEYAIHRYRGPGLHEPDEPSWVIAAHAPNVPLPPPRAIDAVSIGYVWVGLWSLAAFMAARGRADA